MSQANLGQSAFSLSFLQNFWRNVISFSFHCAHRPNVYYACCYFRLICVLLECKLGMPLVPEYWTQNLWCDSVLNLKSSSTARVFHKNTLYPVTLIIWVIISTEKVTVFSLVYILWCTCLQKGGVKRHDLNWKMIQWHPRIFCCYKQWGEIELISEGKVAEGKYVLFYCQFLKSQSFTLVRYNVRSVFINLKYFGKQNFACIMSKVVVNSNFIEQSTVIEIYENLSQKVSFIRHY